MPPKRARRASPSSAALSAGERLKRAKLTGSDYYSAWGWVGTEVNDASHISKEHCLATIGLSKRSPFQLCPNKYALTDKSNVAERSKGKGKEVATGGELQEDIIVISDDETPSCSSKICRSNPYCLNYLGQEKWEDEDKARTSFMKAARLGENPIVNTRDPNIPVGLRNLGATCYANAYLQVWFHHLPFRSGVFKCQPPPDSGDRFEESPIFQLQVTFAAMQESIQSAFNPVKLVESLKLRTTEQQDAQEFSKLFMAHLDTEFHKQPIQELKTLIADQFQGKQVYGTICENCHRRSERDSDFNEIEVNIQENATLEDRIDALLQPELLSGDNQYFCAQCSSLQNARRYTEFRDLPPVLHFSLLRFVYDLASMERKKSKHSISFPTRIDMDHFLGSVQARKDAKKKPSSNSGNVYELRGVLLHKGTSAYHGHYEAQVFDVHNQAWYQFNDETVTKIESLGGKANTNGSANTAKSTNGSQKYRPAKKRRRIDDSESDVEIIESASSSSGQDKAATRSNRISSRDAYMLVYSRIDTAKAEETGSDGVPPRTDTNGRVHDRIPPSPPPRAMETVQALNAEHDRACEEYAAKEKAAKMRFDAVRSMVSSIYKSWNLSERTEDCVVTSRQALETWLARHLWKPSDKKASPSPSTDDNKTAAQTVKAEETDDKSLHSIRVSDIICDHGGLHPEKSAHIKVITKASYGRIVAEDHCKILPEFTPSDVCETCVKESFIEKLYQVEHPQQVIRFDEICTVEEEEPAYWISKQWLKDWRLSKPKMHVSSQPDPPPDAPEYERHVKCEHGGLTPNVISRRRISVEAGLMLQEIFPTWQPVSTSAEVCPVCEALVHMSKEDKREIRKQIEEEKAKLKHMYENSLNGNTALLENVPCAIVPAQFIRTWKGWMLRPAEVSRPDCVDNSQFICEHGQLIIDPNSASDLDSSVAIIKRSDWDVLENLYSAGPLISVMNTGNGFEHDLALCESCRRKRKSEYDATEITLRILGPNEPIPTTDTPIEDTFRPQRSLHQTSLLTYGSRRNGMVRQSNRIRLGKHTNKHHKIAITKDMTVKDLKIMFQEDFNIPTIGQRLFYHGEELSDNASTVQSLGILSHDFLDLREETEDVNLLSDSEGEPSRKKGRTEGQGFGGTLLGSSSLEVITGSDHDRSSEPQLTPPTVKSCSACTFENALDVSKCTICDTPFVLQC